MTAPTHPLASLSEDEIVASARLARANHDAGAKLRFKGISLHEPSKKEFEQYRSQKEGGTYLPPRKAWVNYYLIGTPSFYEVIVNLTAETTEKIVEVPTGLHGPGDDAEILAVEKLALEDPRTQDEIAKLKLPPGAVVVCDPWIW